jgi:hypothetical protein
MNMNKEIKAEIKILKTNRKKILRDEKTAVKINTRQIQQCHMAITRAHNACGRQTSRITKRIAILEGRLS